MGVWKLLWRATKNRWKYPQKKPVPSLYVKSKKKTDILIYIVPGLGGNVNAYTPYLIEPLAKHFDVFFRETYNRGHTLYRKCLSDFVKGYKEAIKLYPHKKIIFVCHSMGNALVSTAIKKHGIRCDAFYAITPFPRPGDRFTKNIDPNKKGIMYYLGPLPLQVICFAPSCMSFLRDLDMPIRIAIAQRDEILEMDNQIQRKRCVNAFRMFKDVSIRIFPKRNHAFKFKQWSFRPVNRDKPEELIDDIIKFVNKIN